MTTESYAKAHPDDGALVGSLEIERPDDDGRYEVVHTMVIDPPVGTLSARLERVMGGILRNAADDVIVFEVGVDGERL